MQASNMYQPNDLKSLFNRTPNEIMNTLERAGEASGAVGRTLLARSSHLKNTRTGMVFPWSEILAEQTDIMVNCGVQRGREGQALLGCPLFGHPSCGGHERQLPAEEGRGEPHSQWREYPYGRGSS